MCNSGVWHFCKDTGRTPEGQARLTDVPLIHLPPQPHDVSSSEEVGVHHREKSAGEADVKTTEVSGEDISSFEEDVRQTKVVSTAKDLVTNVLHVEDDMSVNPWTLRMFVVGKQVTEAISVFQTTGLLHPLEGLACQSLVLSSKRSNTSSLSRSPFHSSF